MNTKMIYRGSMSAPKKEHGDILLGGVVVAREWRANNWVYQVQLPTGIILYHHGE